VTELSGVGAARGKLLANLGILTIRDLLLHRPRRYEDRRRFTPIAQVEAGRLALTCGKVAAMGTKWYKKHSRSIFEVILDDGTARLYCRWWNQPHMEKRFRVGDEVVSCGRVFQLKPRTMDNPETEVVDRGLEGSAHICRVVPVYPLTEGLSQRWVRGLIWRLLREESTGLDLAGILGAGAALSGTDALWRGLDVAGAIRLLHLPETMGDGERARQRLAFAELLELQSRLVERRRRFESSAKALPIRGDNRLIKPLLRRLGFKLTDGQTRALREIRSDMNGAHPMRRLLQGDVGSGKTLVAFCAALMAIESGFSVALMAPTEILAEQHFRTAARLLRPLGVETHILTGSRKSLVEGACPDGAALYIGTHALIEPAFSPANLGLVIIDEQHKFGVSQREDLLRKGLYPHLLVMTATPIPRTLGLTLYGDLDATVIEDMPPGRGRIRTYARDQSALGKVWDFVKRQLDAGRQAYIVYPRIEETSGNVKAVKLEHERVAAALAPHSVAALHGRVGAVEKDAIMSDFAANRVQALLATSLVEVGVDVPNASVMVIENAEQFGLAQLHQLRGRVGRGAHESYCVLVSGAKDPETRERLKALESSVNGFEIAEKDLLLRGPGEFLGQDQSGMPAFRFADLAADLELLKESRQLALVAGARQKGGA
jgi:ATP-dependent DNA helicase RecG